jgi:hypothetical protein
MVIVTDASLLTAFRRLADTHERNGLVTRLRTLQSIRDAYPAGRDDAERIRLFLKDARADWGIEFALMGGDEPLIPMRRAFIDQLPPPSPTTVLLLPRTSTTRAWTATGTPMATCAGARRRTRRGNPGDDADAIPEISVGRAPVTDAKQAQNFVDKTIYALEHPSKADSLDVLLIAGGGFASDRRCPRSSPLSPRTSWP